MLITRTGSRGSVKQIHILAQRCNVGTFSTTDLLQVFLEVTTRLCAWLVVDCTALLTPVHWIVPSP